MYVVQSPQPPPNGGYFPVASSLMGNRPYPQPVYGQQYSSHSTFPHPPHQQNVYFPSFPPSNGQLYPPATSQGMTYGYAAPYTVGPDPGGPPTSWTMGTPPMHPGQDSAYYYWYPPGPPRP